jgi:FtsZ-binding cell division protein ZapB
MTTLQDRLRAVAKFDEFDVIEQAADEIDRLQAEVERLREHAVVLAETARHVERERCAKVCEALQVNKSGDYYPAQAFDGACRACARAVRES